MTRGSAWRDWLICAVWLIHVWHGAPRKCDMTHGSAWHDSCIRVTWLVGVCRMTHSHICVYVSHICVYIHIHVCIYHIYVCIYHRYVCIFICIFANLQAKTKTHFNPFFFANRWEGENARSWPSLFWDGVYVYAFVCVFACVRVCVWKRGTALTLLKKLARKMAEMDFSDG